MIEVDLLYRDTLAKAGCFCYFMDVCLRQRVTTLSPQRTRNIALRFDF
jgi:hypothetical protein